MEGFVTRLINDNRTVVFLVLVAGSLVLYQKQVFFSEQEQKQSLYNWLKEHGLEEYKENLNKAGVKTKESFARLDIPKFLNKYFPDLNNNEHSRYHHHLEIHILKLQNQLAIYYWLERYSLEHYFDMLVELGYNDIDDIKENLNTETIEKITKYEYSKSDLSKFHHALNKIRKAEINEEWSVPASLLYYPFYLCFKVLWFIWWIFKAIVKALGYLSISVFLFFKIRSLINKALSMCQRRKVTALNYAIGNYLDPKRTRVHWQWDEPATVGQAMTFVLEFYRYNLLSYPVDESSGISIEILHKGNTIANSCEFGRSSDNNLQSNQVKVTFTVRQAGEYAIAVQFDREHIYGSPFTKYFLPGPVQPSKCTVVDRLSVVVIKKGTYSPLLIQAKDRFGNTCALTHGNDLNKFKVDINKIGSCQSIDPELFVDTSEFPVANVLHIKLEEEGCYNGVITYDGCPIDNSTLTILCLTMEEWLSVEKNIENHCYNVWYESSLLVSSCQTDNQTTTRSANRTTNTNQNGISVNVSSLDSNTYRISNRKVYSYISPKHLSIKEFYLKIIPRKLHVFRVSPRTKLTLHAPNPSFEHPTFTLSDGIQPPVVVMCKNRNVLVATFSRLVLQNIGGSETFKKKQEFFYQKLLSKHGSKFGCTKLKIDRQNLLESSFNACKALYSSDWLRLFDVAFQGEEGLDWGGLRREWFDLLSGLLFGHENQLFTRFKDDDPQAVVHPNPRRPSNLKLKYYEFAGRIVGKCLYESAVGPTRRQNVKAKFSRSFLAQLLGQRVTYRHFETDDKDLFRSKIKYIEENDPEDLDLKFEEECFSGGQLVKTVELKPGGSHIPVTQENKLEYLDLLAQYRLVNSCQQEVESFMKGLNELVPDSLLSIFDENELELVMCGTGHISVADMKANYTNLFNHNHKVLDWFWTIVSSLTQEELARLVQFVTGSSQLPPGGFSELSPTLQISSISNTDTLPIAHTCFNQLCLPNYTTFEQMQKMLLIAITEGCEGFGFA